MSKRGAEMQGGSDRYGGGDGSETPMDTPTRATAAQLANRKIIGMKSRPGARAGAQNRTNATPSFSGFGGGQQNEPATQNQSFSFSPTPSASTSTSMFGNNQQQSQQSSNAFSFGQNASAPPQASTFSFGGPPAQSNPFSFGFNAPSDKSGPAPFVNPFANNNNASNTTATTSFTNNPSSNTGSSNIFSFGQSPSAPTTNSTSQPPASFNLFSQSDEPSDPLSDNDKKQILDRQHLLSTDQLKAFELILDNQLEPWNGDVKHNKLEQLSNLTQRRLLDLVQGLPALSGQESRSFLAIFGERGRGLTKQWVTDEQRSFIKSAAGDMTSEQQEHLAQVVRDNLKALKDVRSAELPALEQLPHDVQHKMSEYVKSLQKPASPAITNGTASKETPVSKPTFSFGSQSPNQATPAATGASTHTSIFDRPTQEPASTEVSSDSSSNIFSTKQTSTSSIFNSGPKALDSPTKSVQPTFGLAKPAEHNGNAAGTFSFTSPAKTNTTTTFGAQPVVQSPTSMMPSSVKMTNADNASNVKLSLHGGKKNAYIRNLNLALLRKLVKSAPDADHTSMLRRYIDDVKQQRNNPSQTSNKPASQHTSKATVAPSMFGAPNSTSSGTSSSLFNGSSTKRKASEDASAARPRPNPRPSATPNAASPVSLFTPQKPLSETASLFNDILQAPDKPSGNAQTGAAAAPVFSFGAPTSTSSSIADNATTSKTPAMPTFAAPAKTSTNFMAAFGQKAQEQVEKDRAKRKEEDYDSDDDNEEEWERKDKEAQAAKLAQLEKHPRKEMRMVDGKFMLVDVDDNGNLDGSTPGKKPDSSSNPFAKFEDKIPAESMQQSANPFAHLTSSTPAATTNTASLFAKPVPTQSEGSQSIFANSTYKPGSPIRFSTDTKPSEPQSTTPTGSPAKSTASIFGSAANGSGSDATKTTPTFSFGASNDKAKADAPSDKPAVSFNFGASAAPASASTSAGTGAGAVKFNFGTTDSSTKSTSLFAGLNGSTGSSLFNTTSGKPSTGQSMFQSSLPALSPLASTDNSGTNTPDDGEGDGEEEVVKEDQRDLTSLTADEQKAEQVLFEQRARCRKFNRGASPPWESKGVGVLRLLKNKETGATRVLMRQDPSGYIMINASLLKQEAMYSITSDKNVKMVFAEQDGQLATYMITLKTKELGEDLLKAMHAEV